MKEKTIFVHFLELRKIRTSVKIVKIQKNDVKSTANNLESIKFIVKIEKKSCFDYLKFFELKFEI